MTGFLLDTNVLSEFARAGAPDENVSCWIARASPGSLYVSVLTLAEIRRGIERRETGKRRTQLERWFQEELLPSFEPKNILPVTNAVGDRWALLSVKAERQGTRIETLDGLLAATALEYGLTLVTRDKDFSTVDVPVLNPWQ